MDLNDFKDFFISIFNAKIISEDDESIIYQVYNKKVKLNKKHFESVFLNLNNNLTIEETELYNQNNYEILVRDVSRIIVGFFTKEHSITDDVNGLTYSFGPPSDEYVLFFMNNFFLLESDFPKRRYFDLFRLKRKHKFYNDGEERNEIENIPIFDVLRYSIPRLETLKIKSVTNLKKIQFENYSYSYLFSLSYNLNKIIYPLRYFDEFISPYRVATLRRSSLDELEPPKRQYEKDLILYYQKGLSSESLDHQFLSFYHILEHFFEKIYAEDLLNKIKDELTQPSFSYKKKEDIKKLVKIIEKRLKYKNEEFQINELEALELTLSKYVTDFDKLKTELANISPDLINYYKTKEVAFSKGNKVNFEIESNEEIIRNLSKRIYFTRNSIVHSKETEKVKYIPFRDDKYLIPEIHLLRLISEMVIIANSSEI